MATNRTFSFFNITSGRNLIKSNYNSAFFERLCPDKSETVKETYQIEFVIWSNYNEQFLGNIEVDIFSKLLKADHFGKSAGLQISERNVCKKFSVTITMRF